MKNLFFTLAFMLISSIAFASTGLEKSNQPKIIEISKSETVKDCDLFAAQAVSIFEDANIGLTSYELGELREAIYNICTFNSWFE